MNLFDILLNSLDYLSKRNIIELIAKIRTEVIVLHLLTFQSPIYIS